MSETTRTADAEVLRSIAAAPVRFHAIGPAGDLIPEVVGKRSYLHAGPPIIASETTGAMRGALIGALILEGEISTPEQGEEIVAQDEVDLIPCHDAHGVGALAGIVSPTVPVLMVEREGGGRAFATVVEGLDRALSFGNFDTQTLQRLRWLSGEFSEVLSDVFSRMAPVDVIGLQAKSLRRGDEMHNRLVAANEGLIAYLAPAFVEIGRGSIATLEYLRSNPHFFLSLSMAAAKAVAEAIESGGPPGIVTALCGNGIQAGIKVSGAEQPWYLAPAPIPTNMMVIEGKTEEDAAPLMGDSGITETIGLGALSLTASLSLARVLGANAAQSQEVVEKMRQICVTEHPKYQLPADDFAGSPLGISVAAIARTGITPSVNAGYADKVPGRGRVGANLGSFPLGLFEQAAADLGLAPTS